MQPAALCGLGAGFLFALTTVFIKLANQALSGPSLFVRALFVLVVTNTLQTLMQGGFLAWREPRRTAQGVHHLAQFVLGRARCRRWARPAGSPPSRWPTSALVRAVGQVEIVFTLLFSRFYLKETLKRGDVAGLVLVVCGVLLIVLSG